MYTKEQQLEIDRLFSHIEDSPVPMAVVDYLGKVANGLDGQLAWVYEDTVPQIRFGMRDLRHVAIYKLKVVRINRAADRVQ